jgi:hypothetical protein
MGFCLAVAEDWRIVFRFCQTDNSHGIKKHQPTGWCFY